MFRTNPLVSMSLLITLVCGVSTIVFAQDDVPDLDIKSVAIGDLGASTTSATSPTGTKRPPRVSPNIRANALQQAFPNGLLGRSETTVASTSDGQFIIVGFNDAQGFCGLPFGTLPPDPNACTPQSPPGLSGFAFSTDGGLTFTDGGAPDPALFSNVFTRGDPWLERGGLDQLTFYYANLSVDATTGADLGVSVHRGHFTGAVSLSKTYASLTRPGRLLRQGGHCRRQRRERLRLCFAHQLHQDLWNPAGRLRSDRGLAHPRCREYLAGADDCEPGYDDAERSAQPQLWRDPDIAAELGSGHRTERRGLCCLAVRTYIQCRWDLNQR